MNPTNTAFIAINSRFSWNKKLLNTINTVFIAQNQKIYLKTVEFGTWDQKFNLNTVGFVSHDQKFILRLDSTLLPKPPTM